MLKNKILTSVFILLLFWQGYALSQQPANYDPGSRRDPFIPLVTPDGRIINLETEKEEQSALSLEGIIYDKNGVSYAVVNGMVVKIGDRVSDYQVLKIHNDKVVFIKDGEIEEIVLKKEEE